MKGFLAGCISIAIILNQLAMIAVAENDINSLQETTEIKQTSVVEYRDYIDGYNKNTIDFNQNIFLPSSFGGETEISSVNGKESVIFKSSEDSAEYAISVPEDGWYHIGVNYCPLESNNPEIQFSIKLNGSLPYDEAESIKLNRFYSDSGIAQDYNGNEIRTPKSEISGYRYTPLYDSFRIYEQPLLFRMTKGENIIALEFTYANVAIEYVSIYSAFGIIDYEQYNDSVKNKPDNTTENDKIIIQAESPVYTTAKTLYPTYDRQSSITLSGDNSRNSATKLRLNTIGQSTWKQAGQIIAYSFKVENSGFYQIGIRAKQNEARGIYSTRKVTIDNELLFEEMGAVRVPFDDGWQIITLGRDDEPYAFWIEEGEHTIEFEAVSRILGAYTKDLEDIVALLNELYREIIMVTGTSPDNYRDYKLERQIPDLKSRMERYAQMLEDIKKEISSSGVQQGSDMVVIDQLVRQLKAFVEKPRTIPDRLSNFQDAISSFSSWILSLKEQPLEMDYIFIEKLGSEKHIADCGILETLFFRFKMFLSSFTGDYYDISSGEFDGADTLKVWVNLGRDQTQVINDLINNDFKPDYKINVELSLVKQSLVTAIAANRQPDVSIYTGDVVNLAARNSIYAISDIKGFEETKSWFSENAFVPYTYNSKIYAMPLEQNFLMMFYRTDIFEELKIDPPKTWEELNSVITILQKSKLTAGIPASAAIFESILFQSGASFYNEDYSATAFDDERAVAAFTRWTEFYSQYRLPQSYSGLVRFRSGEMPLIIDNYTFYNSLAVGAPEISGLWQMTSIPGTLREDGTFNNTTLSGGNSGVILKSCKNPEVAFNFLKWFASADIQAQYGINVENILGSGSRYDPANIGALSQMSWSPETLGVLLNQIKNSSFEPSIPASYFVGRNLDNAYRAVTIKGKNPREALYSYNVDINAEIKRKRIELGIEEG